MLPQRQTPLLHVSLVTTQSLEEAHSAQAPLAHIGFAPEQTAQATPLAPQLSAEDALQVEPSQQPPAHVSGPQVGPTGAGWAQTPFVHTSELQQFLVAPQASPRWMHRHRRMRALHRRVQQSLSFVHRFAAAEPSPQGPSGSAMPRPGFRGLPVAAPKFAPARMTPSAEAKPRRRVAPAFNARNAASNRCWSIRPLLQMMITVHSRRSIACVLETTSFHDVRTGHVPQNR